MLPIRNSMTSQSTFTTNLFCIFSFISMVIHLITKSQRMSDLLSLTLSPITSWRILYSKTNYVYRKVACGSTHYDSKLHENLTNDHVRPNLLRIEAPITCHLREFAPNLEKYEAMQFFSCVGREIRRIAIFVFDDFISQNEIAMN